MTYFLDHANDSGAKWSDKMADGVDRRSYGVPFAAEMVKVFLWGSPPATIHAISTKFGAQLPKRMLFPSMWRMSCFTARSTSILGWNVAFWKVLFKVLVKVFLEALPQLLYMISAPHLVYSYPRGCSFLQCEECHASLHARPVFWGEMWLFGNFWLKFFQRLSLSYFPWY